jgi:predicted ester cyclase
MGIFGRKNKKQNKEGSNSGGNNTRSTGPSPNSTEYHPPTESTTATTTSNNSSFGPKKSVVIKYVGEDKHVTTTTVDERGRTIQQSVVLKLTPEEMEELGIVPARDAQSTDDFSLDYDMTDYSVVDPLMSEQASGRPSQTYSEIPTPPRGEVVPTPAPVSAPAPAPPVNSGSNNINMMLKSSSTEGQEATVDQTRELVKRFIADIWNRGEVELIPVVCHPSLRFNGHVGMDRVGHDGFSRMVLTVREALTDYHCEIHSMVVESNKAFCRVRFTGKHTGNLLGYPPTGRAVAWMGASEFTCKNGKILKVWELGDLKSLEDQLKAQPAVTTS